MTSLNKNYFFCIYGLLLGNSFIVNNNNKIKIIIKIQDKHTSYFTHIKNKLSSFDFSYSDYEDNITPLVSYAKAKISTSSAIVKKGKLIKVMKLTLPWNSHNNKYYFELYKQWYKLSFSDIHNKTNTGKVYKNIPVEEDLINYFNEESLAYWLMTDGKISQNSLFVNMTKFKDKEIKFFIQFLENKFNLNKIYLNNYWLEFNANNINKIYNITKPYICSSMKFKFITRGS